MELPPGTRLRRRTTRGFKECLARYIKTALTNRETRLGRDGG
jgi:hypothetical protein